MPNALHSPRLILDAFGISDAGEVEKLAGDVEVAKGVIGIPHPYPAGSAVHWIAACHESESAGKALTWAVRLKAERTLVGCITLFLIPKHQRAEIAFWVGRPHWGCGYATEAARAVVSHAFESMGVRRIDGGCFVWNLASAAVLRKLGMKPEGVRRKFMLRHGKVEDLAEYGLLKEN